ncbi:hypothetical protein ACIBO2_20575 [Nonomuraea sp. NPDC050022]|uniref:hypothetical protein n=1 Tax=Nonomuraea sp. NPDC050022 TaxID=3364358 RepID=UPI0037942C8F
MSKVIERITLQKAALFKKFATTLTLTASLGVVGALASPAYATQDPDGTTVVESPDGDVQIWTAGGGSDGCFAEYFNTAYSTKCIGALKSGYVTTQAHCTSGYYYGDATYVSKNTVIRGISDGECTFSVSYANTLWG